MKHFYHTEGPLWILYSHSYRVIITIWTPWLLTRLFLLSLLFFYTTKVDPPIYLLRSQIVFFILRVYTRTSLLL